MCKEEVSAEACLQVYERGGRMYAGVSEGEDPTALYIRTQCLSPYVCLCVSAHLGASEHQVYNHKPQSWNMQLWPFHKNVTTDL